MEIAEEQKKISRKMECETTAFETMAVLLGVLRFAVRKKDNRGGNINASLFNKYKKNNNNFDVFRYNNKPISYCH